MCLIALCLQPGTVKRGYQLVFILCLAVSNNVKTACQLNTKILAGSLEILTYRLTGRARGPGSGALSPPWPPSSLLECICYCMLCDCKVWERELNVSPGEWGERLCGAPLFDQHCYSQWARPLLRDAQYFMKFNVLKYVYCCMRIIITVIIRSFARIGMCPIVFTFIFKALDKHCRDPLNTPPLASSHRSIAAHGNLRT